MAHHVDPTTAPLAAVVSAAGVPPDDLHALSFSHASSIEDALQRSRSAVLGATSTASSSAPHANALQRAAALEATGAVVAEGLTPQQQAGMLPAAAVAAGVTPVIFSKPHPAPPPPQPHRQQPPPRDVFGGDHTEGATVSAGVAAACLLTTEESPPLQPGCLTNDGGSGSALLPAAPAPPTLTGPPPLSTAPLAQVQAPAQGPGQGPSQGQAPQLVSLAMPVVHAPLADAGAASLTSFFGSSAGNSLGPHRLPTVAVGAPPPQRPMVTVGSAPAAGAPQPPLAGHGPQQQPSRASPAGVQGHTQQQTRNLFVAGLAPMVDDVLLQRIFSAYGKVQSAKVMLNIDTAVSRGFGFVLFEEESDAALAKEALNGKPLPLPDAASGGVATTGADLATAAPQLLQISFSRHRGENLLVEVATVYLRNVPAGATAESIREVLSRSGTVESIQFRTQRPRGVLSPTILGQPAGGPQSPPQPPVDETTRGVIATFASPHEARQAVRDLHGRKPFAASVVPLLAKLEEPQDLRVQRLRQQRTDTPQDSVTPVVSVGQAPALPPPALPPPALPPAQQQQLVILNPDGTLAAVSPSASLSQSTGVPIAPPRGLPQHPTVGPASCPPPPSAPLAMPNVFGGSATAHPASPQSFSASASATGGLPSAGSASLLTLHGQQSLSGAPRMVTLPAAASSGSSVQFPNAANSFGPMQQPAGPVQHPPLPMSQPSMPQPPMSQPTQEATIAALQVLIAQQQHQLQQHQQLQQQQQQQQRQQPQGYQSQAPPMAQFASVQCGPGAGSAAPRGLAPPQGQVFSAPVQLPPQHTQHTQQAPQDLEAFAALLAQQQQQQQPQQLSFP